MKFSEQWLREWVDPRLGTAQLAELLTMSGFEVEAIEEWRAAPGARAAAGEPRPGASDRIFDIALTANRGDCLGIRGLAREISLLTGAPLRRAGTRPLRADTRAARRVSLAAAKACPRYAGRVIEEVDATRPTPFFIAERLRRCGLRPVSVVVDITNYVMLESGQPLHAFDGARLSGGITVRFARAGERLELLDGRQCELERDQLVIADAAGAVALAGIMGGMASAVTEATRTLFLEAAWFAPAAIAGRARRLGLQTDASYRFERGVDYRGQVEAIEQASALILHCCGGRAGPVIDVKKPAQLPRPRRLQLRRATLDARLGLELEPRRVSAILKRLAGPVTAAADGWRVSLPPYRFDLGIEMDLVEEVIRIHGYRHLPGRRLGGAAGMHARGPDLRLRGWRRLLAARGYSEAITYSFVDAGLQARLLGEQPVVSLENPLASQQGVMRLSLWPGLLQALQANLARQQGRVRLFESGRIYRPGRMRPTEAARLAGVICGNTHPKQWGMSDTSSDFFDLKGDVEALLRQAAPGLEFDWQDTRHAALQPGQAAEIRVKDQRVGVAGQLHPALLQALELPAPVLLFELELDALPTGLERPAFVVPSRYPAVRRDLALLVDRDLPVSALLEAVRSAAGPVLHNLELFDVYQGEGIDSGKKSLALCLTFQKSSSTLIEEEVEAELRNILNSLGGRFGASLRT